jgi:hypothetical protein
MPPRCRYVADDFPVAGIQDEGDTDHLPIVAGNFKSIRTPPRIAVQSDNLAFVRPVWSLPGVPGEQQGSCA